MNLLPKAIKNHSRPNNVSVKKSHLQNKSSSDNELTKFDQIDEDTDDNLSILSPMDIDHLVVCGYIIIPCLAFLTIMESHIIELVTSYYRLNPIKDILENIKYQNTALIINSLRILACKHITYNDKNTFKGLAPYLEKIYDLSITKSS